MACAFRRGFLNSPSSAPTTPQRAASTHDTPSTLVEAVEADDCPVCLDPLEPQTSVLLPCRHLVCSACTKAVWTVAQADPPKRAKRALECPVCRTEHIVVHGNLMAFLAAHQASNFGAEPATPRTAVRSSQQGGLAALSVHELRLVVRALQVQRRVAGELERSDIERAISQEVDSP